ncbi:MAG: hypothetical protein ACYS8I_00135 [Planctomycetota bacterium]|jgi:hypothetical protein
MIKTLRITSVLLAFLAAGLLVFPVVFGLRGNEKVEEFLNQQSEVSKFREDQRGKKKVKPEVSPIVAQANVFALYLNPPKPPPPKKKKPGKGKVDRGPLIPEVAKKTYHSTRFKVIATSFYAARPELSLALVDEVGTGRHWVRPGDVVSSLTIDAIKDGVVVAKGGTKVFEQPVEARPPQRSLEGGSSPVLKEPGKRISSVISATLDTQGSGTVVGTAADSSEAAPVISEEQAAVIAQARAALEAMAAMADGLEGANLGVSTADKAVSESEDMRISGNEAEDLGRLPRKLQDQDPNRPRSKKTDTSSKKPYRRRKSTKPKPKGRPSSSAGSRAKKSR